MKTSKITINIQLKPNQEQFIQEQLKSGRFNNAEQVIDTAFHLLGTLNEDYLQWLEETRQKDTLFSTEPLMKPLVNLANFSKLIT